MCRKLERFVCANRGQLRYMLFMSHYRPENDSTSYSMLDPSVKSCELVLVLPYSFDEFQSHQPLVIQYCSSYRLSLVFSELILNSNPVFKSTQSYNIIITIIFVIPLISVNFGNSKALRKLLDVFPLLCCYLSAVCLKLDSDSLITLLLLYINIY